MHTQQQPGCCPFFFVNGVVPFKRPGRELLDALVCRLFSLAKLRFQLCWESCRLEKRRVKRAPGKLNKRSFVKISAHSPVHAFQWTLKCKMLCIRTLSLIGFARFPTAFVVNYSTYRGLRMAKLYGYVMRNCAKFRLLCNTTIVGTTSCNVVIVKFRGDPKEYMEVTRHLSEDVR